MPTIINIYCEKQIKSRLEKIARHERRSLSGQITLILERWLKENDSEEK